MGNELYTRRRAEHIRVQERRMPRRHKDVSLCDLFSQQYGVLTFGITRPVCNFAKTGTHRFRKEVGEEHVTGEDQHVWPIPAGVLNENFVHVLLSELLCASSVFSVIQRCNFLFFLTSFSNRFSIP